MLRSIERSEPRENCSDFNSLRKPLFGELHIHTSYSIDAAVADTRNDPRSAYAFARGEEIGLPPYDGSGNATRTLRLARPLDFTAVTDHAENFGELRICTTPGLPGYDAPLCALFRSQIGAPGPGTAFQALAAQVVTPAPVRNPDVCGIGGINCLTAAASVWAETQAAAEEAYDRSSACTFTSFVGYEYTNTVGGNNLHRNIVFRNEAVPLEVPTYFEQQTPIGLLGALRTLCQQGTPGCEFVSIPHNSNLSGGLMFLPPTSVEEATARAANEPLVEIIQVKGESECRTGVGNTDEQCGFEKANVTKLFLNPPTPVPFPATSFVRNALEQGLVSQRQLGVNPFKLGFVGGTDGHDSAPGATDEDRFLGHAGTWDAVAAQRLSNSPLNGVTTNPGGLTVLWAEENSRDSLFSAMQRRESYATSGTRPIVRFFGGFNYSDEMCDAANFVKKGYKRGVPMGGTFTPRDGNGNGRRSPTFAVLATMDPGTDETPGTPLQRVQIIKGWVDSAGMAHEKVFDVAGDASNGAGVDTATCTSTGPGFESLCTVWTDPEFTPGQDAFYYARVLENPTCRWSQRLCNAQGVDCSNPASVPAAFANCCNGSVPATIQERAWTSPIWYTPQS